VGLNTIWHELARSPTYVLTADKDWAEEPALERLVAIAGEHAAPLRICVTDDAEPVRRPPSGVTLGIPNFQTGSTQGDSVTEVPLKIWNFRPSLVASNTCRHGHAAAEAGPRRGVADLLCDILGGIQHRGHVFTGFLTWSRAPRVRLAGIPRGDLQLARRDELVAPSASNALATIGSSTSPSTR
jgi:hypothetical protein